MLFNYFLQRSFIFCSFIHEQWSAYLRKFQFLLEVQGEDGLHAIVGEPLAELVPHDEEHAVGVPQLLNINHYQSTLVHKDVGYLLSNYL